MAKRTRSTTAAIMVSAALVSALVGCGSDSAPGDSAVATSTIASATPTTSRPRPVPNSIDQAAVAPGSLEAMSKVRATDACALHDSGAAARLGGLQEFDRDNSWTACRMVIADAGNPGGYFRFDLELADDYLDYDRERDTAETLSGTTVYHNPYSGGSSGCVFAVPYAETGFAALLSVKRAQPPKNTPVDWPEACAFTREYLTAILPGLTALPAHPFGEDAPGPSLIQKNPCPTAATIDAALPGWRIASTGTPTPYTCKMTLRREGDQHKVTLEVHFQRNNEQIPLEGETRYPGDLNGGYVTQDSAFRSRAGLGGIEIRSWYSTAPSRAITCTAALTFRPAAPAGASTAHILSIGLDISPSAPPTPFDACEQLDPLTEGIVATLR